MLNYTENLYSSVEIADALTFKSRGLNIPFARSLDDSRLPKVHNEVMKRLRRISDGLLNEV